jgi:hypothetical protein
MEVLLLCILALHYEGHSVSLNKLVIYFSLFVTVKCSPIKSMEMYEKFQKELENFTLKLLFHTSVVSS